MFTTLALVLVVLAAFALVWWGVGQLTMPEPVKTVVLVLLGLVALALVYHSIATGQFSLKVN